MERSHILYIYIYIYQIIIFPWDLFKFPCSTPRWLHISTSSIQQWVPVGSNPSDQSALLTAVEDELNCLASWQVMFPQGPGGDSWIPGSNIQESKHVKKKNYEELHVHMKKQKPWSRRGWNHRIGTIECGCLIWMGDGMIYIYIYRGRRLGVPRKPIAFYLYGYGKCWFYTVFYSVLCFSLKVFDQPKFQCRRG